MRRILIAGSRGISPGEEEFNDAVAIFCDKDNPYEQFTVVTGRAQGVDIAGERWAILRGYVNEVHPADWDKYGKSAGHIRNKEMVDSGIDFAIIFWDGESKGTADTMRLLREARIDHSLVITYG